MKLGVATVGWTIPIGLRAIMSLKATTVRALQTRPLSPRRVQESD